MFHYTEQIRGHLSFSYTSVFWVHHLVSTLSDWDHTLFVKHTSVYHQFVSLLESLSSFFTKRLTITAWIHAYYTFVPKQLPIYNKLRQWASWVATNQPMDTLSISPLCQDILEVCIDLESLHEAWDISFWIILSKYGAR